MEINYLSKPILLDPLSDDGSNSSHIVIGGIIDFSSIRDITEFYKISADDLVDNALRESDLSYQYSYPIIYLYRHSLELYIKSFLGKFPKTHRFSNLKNTFSESAKNKLSNDVFENVINRLNEFEKLDNESIRFRYGQIVGEEFMINLKELKLIFHDIRSVFFQLTE